MGVRLAAEPADPGTEIRISRARRARFEAGERAISGVALDLDQHDGPRNQADQLAAAVVTSAERAARWRSPGQLECIGGTH
jgi:hypothetical protein